MFGSIRRESAGLRGPVNSAVITLAVSSRVTSANGVIRQASAENPAAVFQAILLPSSTVRQVVREIAPAALGHNSDAPATLCRRDAAMKHVRGRSSVHEISARIARPPACRSSLPSASRYGPVMDLLLPTTIS